MKFNHGEKIPSWFHLLPRYNPLFIVTCSYSKWFLQTLPTISSRSQYDEACPASTLSPHFSPSNYFFPRSIDNTCWKYFRFTIERSDRMSILISWSVFYDQRSKSAITTHNEVDIVRSYVLVIRERMIRFCKNSKKMHKSIEKTPMELKICIIIKILIDNNHLNLYIFRRESMAIVR